MATCHVSGASMSLTPKIRRSRLFMEPYRSSLTCIKQERFNRYSYPSKIRLDDTWKRYIRNIPPWNNEMNKENMTQLDVSEHLINRCEFISHHIHVLKYFVQIHKTIDRHLIPRVELTDCQKCTIEEFNRVYADISLLEKMCHRATAMNRINEIRNRLQRLTLSMRGLEEQYCHTRLMEDKKNEFPQEELGVTLLSIETLENHMEKVFKRLCHLFEMYEREYENKMADKSDNYGNYSDCYSDGKFDDTYTGMSSMMESCKISGDSDNLFENDGYGSSECDLLKSDSNYLLKSQSNYLLNVYDNEVNGNCLYNEYDRTPKRRQFMSNGIQNHNCNNSCNNHEMFNNCLHSSHHANHMTEFNGTPLKHRLNTKEFIDNKLTFCAVRDNYLNNSTDCLDHQDGHTHLDESINVSSPLSQSITTNRQMSPSRESKLKPKISPALSVNSQQTVHSSSSNNSALSSVQKIVVQENGITRLTNYTPPPNININRYKTELCRPFEEKGVCRYGTKCQFAHGKHELRDLDRHPKYKTERCKTYHTKGFCPYGRRCHFLHDDLGSSTDLLYDLELTSSSENNLLNMNTNTNNNSSSTSNGSSGNEEMETSNKIDGKSEEKKTVLKTVLNSFISNSPSTVSSRRNSVSTNGNKCQKEKDNISDYHTADYLLEQLVAIRDESKVRESSNDSVEMERDDLMEANNKVQNQIRSIEEEINLSLNLLTEGVKGDVCEHENNSNNNEKMERELSDDNEHNKENELRVKPSIQLNGEYLSSPQISQTINKKCKNNGTNEKKVVESPRTENTYSSILRRSLI
ncbi:hypothetical protein SNEBB_001823 [Seison nebaliae]|nr:hypothetical protein SNEBB_001823 [Seison nebaliae]